MVSLFWSFQVEKAASENLKFAENNKHLEQQNAEFSSNNEQLSATVSALEEQSIKFNDMYEKLRKDYGRLSDVRDGLEEQVGVSSIFNFLFLNCSVFAFSFLIMFVFSLLTWLWRWFPNIGIQEVTGADIRPDGPEDESYGSFIVGED